MSMDSGTPRARALHGLIARSEDDLMGRVLDYAHRQEYTRYTSTLREAWRASIAGLSAPLLEMLEHGDQPAEMGPDDNPEADPVAAFGILEAQRHRARGVPLGMFLGLMKYYRQSYLDVVAAAGFERADEDWALLFVTRFFDRVELGYCVEWSKLSATAHSDELEAENRHLANEKNKYLTLFSSLGPPVLLLDRDDRIADMNFAAERLFFHAQSPGESYYGEPVRRYLPPALSEAVETFHVDGRPQLRTMVTLREDGESRDFDVNLHRMLDISGKFTGTTILLNDITERVRLSRELREARDAMERRVAERTAELREALESLHREVREHERVEAEQKRLDAKVREMQRLQSLGVLAGGIAHDFNNLLTTVLGNAELVAQDLADRDPNLGRIHHIEIASRRAADLCRQMLAYSGRGPLEMQEVDLVGLMRGMGDLLQASIPRSVTLEYRFPARASVRGDVSQLRQVVLNLIVNAAEAIGTDGGRIELALEPRLCGRDELDATAIGLELPEGEYVAMTVTDNGCGMDPETLEHIFDPFFSKKFVGRGLGMPVVLGIVRGHRGTISIHTESGRGTSMCILLPVYVPIAQDAAPCGPAQRTSVAPCAGGALLLVDDDDMVRQVTAQMLASGGWRVIAAENGHQALELWAASRDLVERVVLDVSMPGLDGPATLAALRGAGCEVPAVMISGHETTTVEDRLHGLGAVGIVRKPFGRAELLATVQMAESQPA